MADVEKRLQSGEVSNTPSDNYVAEELPEVEGEETTSQLTIIMNVLTRKPR